MIRLLPARPPLARGRRLLASLPPGLMTILTVGAAVGVVLGMPWFAATLDEPAPPQGAGRPATIDVSATAPPAATSIPRDLGPAVPPPPTAPASAVTHPGAGVALLAGARLPAAEPGPPARSTADPTPVAITPRPEGEAPPDAPAAGGPGTAHGVLGDPSSTSVRLTVSSTGSRPTGHLEVRSRSVHLEAVAVDALEVQGRVASWSGEARWAGTPGHTFAATAVDGTAAGAPGIDRIAISVHAPNGALAWQADWPVVAGDIDVDATGATLRGGTTGGRPRPVRIGPAQIWRARVSLMRTTVG